MGEISEALRRAAQSSKRPSETDRKSAPADGRGEQRSFAADHARTLDVDPRLDAAALAEVSQDERPRVALPRDRGEGWVSRVVLVAPNTPAAECYRHFAIRVARDMGDRKARSVLIAGGLRMEGKTTTACNLALALAAMGGGRRIALVDLDLRAPSVSRVFGLAPEAGVEEVLSGHVPVSDVRIATDLEGFDIYPVARSAAQPHELLAGEPLALLLRELEAAYDTVVLDSAPLLLVPDTELVYPHVDCITAVMRSGVTKRSDFERLIETIPESKLLGTFMNDVRTQRHIKRYGYYGGDR